MLAVHARYRGRSVRRAELVQRSAAALSTLEGVGVVLEVSVDELGESTAGEELLPGRLDVHRGDVQQEAEAAGHQGQLVVDRPVPQ